MTTRATSTRVSTYSLWAPIRTTERSIWRFSEVLSSDEDEIDDVNQEYLEKLQDKIKRSSAQHGFNVNATIQEGGDHRSDVDDDDDTDFDANEETALESYVTPLDSDDSNQDEYVVFKEVIQSKYRARVILSNKS